MFFIQTRSILTGLFLATIAVLAQAESHQHGHHNHGHQHEHPHAQHHHQEHKEHVQHGAHEHGVAAMTIVAMGKEVLVEVKSPLYNMLGFEHDAHNATQQTLIKQQLQRISAAQLIQLNAAAQCQLTSQHTQHPFVDEHEHKPGHKHEHPAENKTQHRDIQFEYHYACQNPKALTQLNAKNLFQAWPNLKTLRTEWIYQKQQSASQLTPNAATVTFK